MNKPAANKAFAAMLAEGISINISLLYSRSSWPEEQHSALSIIFHQKQLSAFVRAEGTQNTSTAASAQRYVSPYWDAAF